MVKMQKKSRFYLCKRKFLTIFAAVFIYISAMNRKKAVFPILICLLLVFNLPIFSEEPLREFRATWLTTHYCIDWPSTQVTSTGNATQIAKQKSQLTAILDTLVAGNLNATMLQVRPTADAFYQSSYEPWSKNLTGTRGMDPGYDPLAFAIEEAHRRGLELHAWINPFRYETSAGSYGNTDIRAAHPDWIIAYNNGSFKGTILDPGIPEVRQYVTNVVMEIVNNYDIDGMIWDDYFYPYGGTTTEDAASKALYKPAGMSDGDWRRQNVNLTVQMIYDSIQAVKPWVRFGIAPFGIWTTQSAVASSYGIQLPSGITGLDDYSVQFCDPVAWVRGGYVDYIAPQIYWPTTSSGQCYTTLAQWWGQTVCKHFSDQLPNKKVHFYSANNDYSDWVSVVEAGREVAANRQYAPFNAPGAIFYNTSNYKTKGLVTGMKSQGFADKCLVPAMDWKPTTPQGPVSQLQLAGNVLSWEHPTADRFSLYVWPRGTNPELGSSTRYLKQVVYGKEYAFAPRDSAQNMSIAVCAYDRYGNEYDPVFFNRADSEVVDTIAVHVNGIRMRLKEHTMSAGDSIELKVTISPSNATNKSVIWTSSDERIAIVSPTTNGGMVHALAGGETIITATTEDGGFSATCKMTVNGAPPAEETAVENVEAVEKAQLILLNGQLYIRKGDAIYSISGQRIR